MLFQGRNVEYRPKSSIENLGFTIMNGHDSSKLIAIFVFEKIL